MGYIADCFEICPANGLPSMDMWLDRTTGRGNKRKIHEEFGEQFYSACAAIMSYLTPTEVWALALSHLRMRTDDTCMGRGKPSALQAHAPQQTGVSRVRVQRHQQAI